MTGTDLSAVHSINKANVPAVGEASPAHLARLLDLAELALVVEFDRNVVGFCIVLAPGADYDSPNYRYFCERYDSFAYLDRVAFAEGFRSRGLGHHLYEEVERRVDANRLTLEVNLQPRNEGSLRFHAREGFTEVGRLEPYPGTVVSLMSK